MVKIYPFNIFILFLHQIIKDVVVTFNITFINSSFPFYPYPSFPYFKILLKDQTFKVLIVEMVISFTS